MAESIIATMNALNSLESSRHRPSIFIRHEFITILTQRRTIFAHFARENVTKKKKKENPVDIAHSRGRTQQEEKHVETPGLRKRFENERSAARGGIFRAVARHYRPLSPSVAQPWMDGYATTANRIPINNLASCPPIFRKTAGNDSLNRK